MKDHDFPSRLQLVDPQSALGLEPYNGDWGWMTAAHLLRRTTFGPTAEQIRLAAEEGLDATIDKLFQPLPLPDPPVNCYYTGDPAVPVGATWVEAPYTESLKDEQMSYRYRSLLGWTAMLMFEEGVSIREKLTLFWHNHFPINQILDPKYLYRYITLHRTHAWGNFRDLVKAVTIDPAMLVFLNGSDNVRNRPNENYARELLELFTIGKGPQVSPGDYTFYTEQDVREIARVLSGWRDFGFVLESEDGTITSVFSPQRHDDGLKQLSYRFGEATIPNMNEGEYAFLIDIIFRQEEVARFISRKLYQWFVYYQITDEAEQQVIRPMAQLLIDHDYQLEPALKALLSSAHFFAPRHFGVMIKNPFDFMMSALKPLQVELSDDLLGRCYSGYSISGLARTMQMEYFEIPEVAGWKAYYRGPLYYRNWINASTLPLRKRFVDELCTQGVEAFERKGKNMVIEPLRLTGDFPNPADPNELIRSFGAILLPKPLTDDQLLRCREVLLSGLPDFEWTVEYEAYRQDPGNSGLAAALENKLKELVRTLLNMAEFHLS